MVASALSAGSGGGQAASAGLETPNPGRLPAVGATFASESALSPAGRLGVGAWPTEISKRPAASVFPPRTVVSASPSKELTAFPPARVRPVDLMANTEAPLTGLPR